MYFAFVDYEIMESRFMDGNASECCVEGKLFKVVYNMYKYVKSSVYRNNEYSASLLHCLLLEASGGVIGLPSEAVPVPVPVPVPGYLFIC